MKFYATLLFLTVFCYSNVGGIFRKPSLAGLSLDSSASIVKAETQIICNDTICSFNTNYKVNKSNEIFYGKYYGIRYSNLMFNDTLIKVDTTKIMNSLSDVDVFGEKWIFENYQGQINYKSTVINVESRNDSSFSVSGLLHPTTDIYWGLAANPGMTSLRHPFLFNKKTENVNEYNVSYCFMPIQTFDSLKIVKAKFIGHNVTLVKTTELYRKGRKINKDLNNNEIEMMYKDTVPLMVNYRFRPNGQRSGRKNEYLSIGGPTLYLGKSRNQYVTEIGWEPGLNISLFSIMPSANIELNTSGYNNFNFGIRLMTMGMSLGAIYKPDSKIEGAVGISLGFIGVEFRSNGLYFQFSL